LTHYEYAKQVLWRKTYVSKKAFTTTVASAGLAKRKVKRNCPFKTEDGLAISKPSEIISEKVLGDIVEAEFHFDRYNQF
jgi:hypothetical protein